MNRKMLIMAAAAFLSGIELSPAIDRCPNYYPQDYCECVISCATFACQEDCYVKYVVYSPKSTTTAVPNPAPTLPLISSPENSSAIPSQTPVPQVAPSPHSKSN